MALLLFFNFKKKIGFYLEFKTSVVCVAENDKEKVSKIDTQGIRTSGEERKIGELPNEVLSFIPKEF